MCGIVGLISKSETGKSWRQFVKPAVQCIYSRGPDAQNFFDEDMAEGSGSVSFGHLRLTIIDLSSAANQPMFDQSNRHVIIYNGEIFNFRDLKRELEASGVSFQTQSDTEVLLQLYKKHGREMLKFLNGFFAFAIYDRDKKTTFIARDRFGVKPLIYYEDESHFVFSSEMKALMQFPVIKDLDETSLYTYLQLNYIPAPHTIFKQVKKLLPGHYLFYDNGKVEEVNYYSLAQAAQNNSPVNNYETAQKRLFELMVDAVQVRLISDVPLGSFLSGGVDSSIVSGLASLQTKHLKTFSIGYKEDDFFDETQYARIVAKHFKTDHTVFSLARSDLFESLDDVLNYLDEPFGDSSALPVYVLSKHTRQHVKVALSGDGADELFGGYVKHGAEFRARHPHLPEMAASFLTPLWKALPRSRNSKAGNVFRQLQKFGEGMKMNERERYWRWCSLADEEQAKQLMSLGVLQEEYAKRKNFLMRFVNSGTDLNPLFMNDAHMVLPDDMLFKVDSMSMANSLEIRNPFLDYRVAEFAFSIPAAFKVDRLHKKRIVHDTFRNFLPAELYHRPKRGFEIPLHSFLTRELKSMVNEYLNEDFIHEQNIFNSGSIKKLKLDLFSNAPNDSAARIWGLLVFQHWWKKWIARG